MAEAIVRDLLDAGVHFGHHASRWNPKMAPFIYGKRNSVHIIDIRETVRGLLRAKKFLSQVVSRGDDVLFIGTKRQARDAVQQTAERTGMHYVTERWLGGLLTNARTIRSRLQRLRELEELADSPKWDTDYSKKMRSMLSRELKKIQRNLNGVRNMNRQPGAAVVVDVRKEKNALQECRTLGIPTVCLIDTDSDPDYASIPIPGNDDAMRAIRLVLAELAESCEEGKRARPIEKERDDDDGPGGRRRQRGPQRETPRDAKPEPEAVGATAGGEAPPSAPDQPEPSA